MRSLVVCCGRLRALPILCASFALLTLACGLARAADAEKDADDPKEDAKLQRAIGLLKSIQWQEGPTTAKLGTVAEIKVPEGYRFTGQDGAAKWAERYESIPSPAELGVLVPKKAGGWYIVFSYEDSGHVPDKEKLDAAAIMKSLREGNDEANEMRKQRGWAPLALAGWSVEPNYDPETHHLVWGLRVTSEGQESINYNTKLLGRGGVMTANLVVAPKDCDAALGSCKQLLAGYEFTSGSKYSEWRPGEKIAEYGLTGLITGGLVVAAAKSGLLAKLGFLIVKFVKPIIIGIVAIGAGIAKFFRGIFGGRAKSNM